MKQASQEQVPIPTLFYRYVWEGSLSSMNLSNTGTQPSVGSLDMGTDWLGVLEGRAAPAGAISEFMLGVLGSNSRRRVEASAERFRRQVRPTAPSRATCVFAFGDPDSAQLAADRFGWDSSRMVTLTPRGRINAVRSDMEIVSIANGATDKGHQIVGEDRMWTDYWRGLPHPRSVTTTCEHPGCEGETWEPPDGPIWEWLVEGMLEATPLN